MLEGVDAEHRVKRRVGKGQSRRVTERQPKSVPARNEIHTRILAARFTNKVARESTAAAHIQHLPAGKIDIQPVEYIAQKIAVQTVHAPEGRADHPRVLAVELCD